MVWKNPEAYDITARVKAILESFDYEVQQNDQKKIVILLRKNERFRELILRQFIVLEDNGDFGAMHLLAVSTMDLIKPLVCNYLKQESPDNKCTALECQVDQF